MVKLGIIGGSGLEKLNLFKDVREVSVETRYGAPSSPFFTGTLEDCEVYILSRHNRDHSITPSGVNNRANIEAFRKLDCKYLFSTTACGSLQDRIRPGDLVIPDQFIDFTKRRINTFYDHFEGGNIAHTAMADPFSSDLREMLIRGCAELGISHHPAGTVITIEGPRFSTRAESRMFRILGADVINMSIAPEASLANEAGIPYATVALSTDYDAWKHEETPVSWEMIASVFNENVKHVTSLLIHVIKNFKATRQI